MAQNTTRLCKLLGVNVNEEFGYGSYIFRVNRIGTFQMKKDDGTWESPNAAWLCSVIADKESIHRRQWTDEDVEDAEAVRRLWPDATHVRVDALHNKMVYKSYGNTGETLARISDRTFSCLNSYESVALDDILRIGDEIE